MTIEQQPTALLKILYSSHNYITVETLWWQIKKLNKMNCIAIICFCWPILLSFFLLLTFSNYNYLNKLNRFQLIESCVKWRQKLHWNRTVSRKCILTNEIFFFKKIFTLGGVHKSGEGISLPCWDFVRFVFTPPHAGFSKFCIF